MKKFNYKGYPWFTRVTFDFEEVKPGAIASCCDGNIIVDARRSWRGDIYVKPGFHAVKREDNEYDTISVAAYEDNMGAMYDVWPLDESTPEEWAQAQQLLAGTIQRVQSQEELEDAEDLAELEAESRLTGIRYRL